MPRKVGSKSDRAAWLSMANSQQAGAIDLRVDDAWDIVRRRGNGGYQRTTILMTPHSTPDDYIRIRVARDAEEGADIHRALRAQASRVAKRDNLAFEAGFRKVFEQYWNHPLFCRARHVFPFLGALWQAKLDLYYPEDLIGLVKWAEGKFERTWAGKEEGVVYKEFWRRFYGVAMLLKGHLGCEPIGATDASRTSHEFATRALDWWAEVNYLVPPCAYLRLIRACTERNLPLDVCEAILREHGAERLDDLAELVLRDLVNEQVLWELATDAKLTRALSFDQLVWLLPRFRESHNIGLRVLALTHAAKLPSLDPTRGRTLPTPVKSDLAPLVAAHEYMYPAWQDPKGWYGQREYVFAATHAYRPGSYIPTESVRALEAPLPTAGNPDLAAEIEPAPTAEPKPATRTSLSTQYWIGSLAGVGTLARTDGDAPLVLAKRGPLAQAMDAICPQCGDAMMAGWVLDAAQMKAEGVREGDLLALETAVGRMITHEHRVRPEKTQHMNYVVKVVNRAFGNTSIADDYFPVRVLAGLEHAGICFNDPDEFRKVYLGIMKRAAPNAERGGDLPPPLEQLLEQLTTHVPHLGAAGTSATMGTDALLLAIDLFADLKGDVPMCKCLRAAMGLAAKGIPRMSAFHLARMFGITRFDDLVALAERQGFAAIHADQLLEDPDRVRRTSLSDLTAAR